MRMISVCVNNKEIYLFVCNDYQLLRLLPHFLVLFSANWCFIETPILVLILTTENIYFCDRKQIVIDLENTTVFLQEEFPHRFYSKHIYDTQKT